MCAASRTVHRALRFAVEPGTFRKRLTNSDSVQHGFLHVHRLVSKTSSMSCQNSAARDSNLTAKEKCFHVLFFFNQATEVHGLLFSFNPHLFGLEKTVWVWFLYPKHDSCFQSIYLTGEKQQSIDADADSMPTTRRWNLRQFLTKDSLPVSWISKTYKKARKLSKMI